MPLENPTRNISPELLEALFAEAQTLAACILVEPEYGDMLGLTTSDEAFEFEGETYHPDPGLSATEVAAAISYAVDNLEITGAFDEELVKKLEVLGGVYDDADYTIFLVDYEHPEYGRMVVQRGTLGNVESVDEKFTLELRGLTQKLQQTRGELTSPLCRADIFDSRCKLDEDGTHPTLAIPYKYAGVEITEVVGRFTFKCVIAEAALPAGFFEAGLLVWTGGENANQRSEVKTHTKAGTTHTITLQDPVRTPFVLGDEFRVRKGCKKTMDACFDVHNVENKRSEDYLPGLVDTMRRP